MKVTLTEVNFNASQNFNLMSLTRLLIRGWKIKRGDDTGIYVEKDGNKINFGIVIRTTRGAVFPCRFICEDAEVSAGSVEKEKKEKKERKKERKKEKKVITMNIAKAHTLIGHMHEDQVQKVMQ